MLTDYEALPEFVPNLVLCERLPLPNEAASRMVRLRQVPCWPARLPICPSLATHMAQQHLEHPRLCCDPEAPVYRHEYDLWFSQMTF